MINKKKYFPYKTIKIIDLSFTNYKRFQDLEHFLKRNDPPYHVFTRNIVVKTNDLIPNNSNINFSN